MGSMIFLSKRAKNTKLRVTLTSSAMTKDHHTIFTLPVLLSSQAAGKIHSDIERGFIRAETINFDEMMACGGSVAAAKEKGLLRSEGKDYVVKDGDMIYFRFNV